MTSYERKEDLGLVYGWLWMAYKHHPMVKRNHPNRQNFEQYTWLFTLPGRRNVQTCYYKSIHGLWLVVLLDGQDLERT